MIARIRVRVECIHVSPLPVPFICSVFISPCPVQCSPPRGPSKVAPSLARGLHARAVGATLMLALRIAQDAAVVSVVLTIGGRRRPARLAVTGAGEQLHLRRRRAGHDLSAVPVRRPGPAPVSQWRPVLCRRAPSAQTSVSAAAAAPSPRRPVRGRPSNTGD